MSQSSDIVFSISLDENNVPEKITWEATDSGQPASECKSVFVSLWDEKEENTLRIDLWTKEMMVDDMKKFVHQTMVTMADTFERATGEAEMAKDMREFSRYFAEKLKLIPPGQSSN